MLLERVLGVCDSRRLDRRATSFSGASRLFFLAAHAWFFEVLTPSRLGQDSVLLNALVESAKAGFE